MNRPCDDCDDWRYVRCGPSSANVTRRRAGDCPRWDDGLGDLEMFLTVGCLASWSVSFLISWLLASATILDAANSPIIRSTSVVVDVVAWSMTACVASATLAASITSSTVVGHDLMTLAKICSLNPRCTAYCSCSPATLRARASFLTAVT